MTYLLNRLKEPSSWAALAAILAGVGLNIEGDLLQHITNIGVALAGLVGFLLADKK